MRLHHRVSRGRAPALAALLAASLALLAAACDSSVDNGVIEDWYNNDTQTAAPVFSPPPGKYPGPLTVTLTCKTEAALIYYTTDGSNPAASSTRVPYEGPFRVEPEAAIKAWATKEGMNPSSVVTGSYKPISDPIAILAYYFSEPLSVGYIGEQSGTESDPVSISLTIPAESSPPEDEKLIHVLFTPEDATVSAASGWTAAGRGWERAYEIVNARGDERKYYRVSVTERSPSAEESPEILLYYFARPPAAGSLEEKGGTESDPHLITLTLPARETPPEEALIHILTSPQGASLAKDGGWTTTAEGWTRNYDVSLPGETVYYRVEVRRAPTTDITLSGRITFRWAGSAAVRTATENGYTAYEVTVLTGGSEKAVARVDARGYWGPVALDASCAGQTAQFRLTLNKGGRMGVMAMDDPPQDLSLSGAGSVLTADLVERRLPVGDPAELWSWSTSIYEEYTSVYQICDIDLNTGSDWAPLRNVNGTFNGGGYKIFNLRINSPEETDVGLFKTLNGTLKNAHIASGSVAGNYHVGAFAGRILVGSIHNCTNAASVTGDHQVGGICGAIVDWAPGAAITGCLNSGAVTGTGGDSETGTLAGGITGYQGIGSVILGCKNTGEVSGSLGRVGGIAGLCLGSLVAACYNTADIKETAGALPLPVPVGVSFSTFRIGGILGSGETTESGAVAYHPRVTSCYNKGTLSYEYGIPLGGPGGLIVGTTDIGQQVTYCYWTAQTGAVPIGEAGDGAAPLASYQFSSEAWPADSDYWQTGVGDLDADGVPDDGKGWWQSLGVRGTISTPVLFWE